MKHPIRRCTARGKDGRRYCSWAVRHSHEPLCARRLAASHREASHREASHREASHREASHREASHHPKSAQRRLWGIALKHGPLDRIRQIRKAKPDFIARQNRTKQVPVHPSTSEDVK